MIANFQLQYIREHLISKDKPREQVAVNPIPLTSSPDMFAREHAAFTAAQIACQISVDDCW